MSRFFSAKFDALTPYTPGEQPKDRKFIKLNTNESPFPPCGAVIEAVKGEAEKLQLYSDPESRALTEALAKRYDVKYENVLCTNGSDEILNFAFMAFSDENNPIVFPDITYGFYPVFCQINNIPYETIPLLEDFTIDYKMYCGIGKNIVIANPNAPTGILMPIKEIEEIVKSNPNNIVIIDEAYIDFSGNISDSALPKDSAVPLTKKYNNLIVTQTFSKSRSLAGARLGFGIACEELINDLNTIKYSTNPYNVNRMTSAAGLAAIENDDYYMNNCKTIIENREWTRRKLEEEGFTVLPSNSNFLFAKIGYIKGIEVYNELRKEGILVRHFETERLKSYNRITIGSKAEMEALIKAIQKIKAKD
ncbi:MAG: histidinol-phosphate transaminase [Oscillospiraceae bacterium]|nr:histidinol-phosphate transaminase [Oscillospiraceae bacterium]